VIQTSRVGKEQYFEIATEAGPTSRIYARGLKASEDAARYVKFAGLTLAGVYVDQPEEIPHDFYTALKARLKVLDHCAIYLLIAGTYTPISQVGLREHGGWWLFGAIWTLAVGGVVFKLLTRGRFQLLSTLIYIAMGWLAVVAIKPMTEQLSTWALAWIFSGGVAYTLGTLFYMSRRIRYTHTIWHGFVLAGSALHFAAVATQVWA
jgi:channel protein (hemolysin III family)